MRDSSTGSSAISPSDVGLVADLGLDLEGWGSLIVTGVSDDGLTIVSRATNPEGFGEAWIATIPEPSTALLPMAGLLGLAVRRR